MELPWEDLFYRHLCGIILISRSKTQLPGTIPWFLPSRLQRWSTSGHSSPSLDIINPRLNTAKQHIILFAGLSSLDLRTCNRGSWYGCQSRLSHVQNKEYNHNMPQYSTVPAIIPREMWYIVISSDTVGKLEWFCVMDLCVNVWNRTYIWSPSKSRMPHFIHGYVLSRLASGLFVILHINPFPTNRLDCSPSRRKCFLRTSKG